MDSALEYKLRYSFEPSFKMVEDYMKHVNAEAFEVMSSLAAHISILEKEVERIEASKGTITVSWNVGPGTPISLVDLKQMIKERTKMLEMLDKMYNYVWSIKVEAIEQYDPEYAAIIKKKFSPRKPKNVPNFDIAAEALSKVYAPEMAPLAKSAIAAELRKAFEKGVESK